MDLSLRNRTALVTGSSRGIGRVIAHALAKEGVDMILCGRSQETLTSTKREMEDFGVAVYEKTLDVTKPENVKSLFDEVVAKIGRLDILVNNVGGVTSFGSFLDLEPKDWHASIDLNFMSMVYFSKYAMPWLKKSDQARIINISTVPARQPGLFNPHYSVAKAAVLNLSKYLANNFAKDGVRVNSICPSTIVGGNWNERVADRAKRDGLSSEEGKKIMENEERNKVPLGELGFPEDIASMVLYLASAKSRFITGTCIDVDGGVVRSMF